MSAHDEVVDTQFETIFQNKHPQDRNVQSVTYKKKKQNKKVMAKKNLTTYFKRPHHPMISCMRVFSRTRLIWENLTES